MQIELDRNEMRILHILQRHGDLSAAQVAEKAGMSVSTCWRHIHRLEDLWVIRNRVAIVDREKVGLNVMVFAQVKLSAHGRDALMKFEQSVRRHPEVLDCYTVMGEQDFLLRIVEKDIKSYPGRSGRGHANRASTLDSVARDIAQSWRSRVNCASAPGGRLPSRQARATGIRGKRARADRPRSR